MGGEGLFETLGGDAAGDGALGIGLEQREDVAAAGNGGIGHEAGKSGRKSAPIVAAGARGVKTIYASRC